MRLLHSPYGTEIPNSLYLSFGIGHQANEAQTSSHFSEWKPCVEALRSQTHPYPGNRSWHPLGRHFIIDPAKIRIRQGSVSISRG